MIFKGFKTPKGLTRTALPSFDAPIRPDVPFFAVGDVHGCDHLLDGLLNRLDSLRHPEALLVMTGDYVDRGEDTARVLRRLMVLSRAAGDLMHCIMGNHEKMLLDVLDDPVAHGPRWLRHGGLQTLASYRVNQPAKDQSEKAWRDMRDQLAERMGEDTIDWIRDLPLSWQTGNVVVVHAGADPDVPMAAQDRSTLLWGHPEFRRKPRRDGLWIVHGHTIVEAPQPDAGRIPTDTGAYATGILSAALVETDKVTFYQA
ncbi:metallophosphoesterase family protein [Antarctobacter jejuensis]|uniref:metallophosphoesterase family protein n=1 Tax=Antarctobacter jejuensis TaxID=1439938 RepID=UPI003FD456CD